MKMALVMLAALSVGAYAQAPAPAATVREKAHQINTGGAMGCLEEIGSLPRTMQELFEAGHASGSIMAAHATYGKGASKAVYGEVKRFVSRERVEQILAKLFQDSVKYAHFPGEEAPPETRLFAFGNTVATSPSGPGGGWMGVRYRTKPEGKVGEKERADGASEIVVEFRVESSGGPAGQADLIGKLGVNLVHAAFWHAGSAADLLSALTTEVNDRTHRRAEIRAVHVSGPDTLVFEPRRLGLELIKAGLADLVLMSRGPDGAEPVDPGDVLHGHVPLAFRTGAVGPWPTPGDDLAAALAPLVTGEATPLALKALPVVPVISPVPSSEEGRVVAAQAAAVGQSGACVLAASTDPAALGRFLGESTRHGVLVAVDRGELRAVAASLDAEWRKTALAHAPQVRYAVAVPDGELADLIAGPGSRPVATAVDEAIVVVVLQPSGTVVLPAAKLASVLRVLPAPPAKKPASPLYRVPVDAAAARAALSPDQAADLDRQVAAGVLAIGAP